MLNYFPTPYEDELLYSIFARYHKYSGNVYILTTTQELLKCRKATAMVDLPCNLDGLLSNMPTSWNYSIEKIVNEHTLYPFYKPFWGAERAELIMELMKGKESRQIHLRAGINTNQIRLWKYLRFCPDCFEEDIQMNGEAYWHRLHQIPGVLVCPKHKRIILNSRIRTYEVNSQYYYAAERENCPDNSQECSMSLHVIDKLVCLANEVMWLLTRTSSHIGPEEFKMRYLEILQEWGFVSKKGRVNQNRLVEKFISHYGEELLNSLNLLPDLNNSHNWVSLMLRKYEQPPHPIKHLLFMDYLSGSVKGYFQAKNEQKPFGDGPYPCLNSAAEHYKQHIIDSVKIEYSRNKRLFGIFQCSCGFVYTRQGSDNIESDRYKYSTIKTYGDLWEKTFCKLIEYDKLPLREVARILKVDLQTVRKYVSKFELKTSRMSDQSKRSFQKLLANISNNGVNESLKNKNRESWLSLVKENPGLSKSQIRKIDRHIYSWLYYHDREWFVKNLPVVGCYNHTHSTVDWTKRDEQICSSINELVRDLLETNHKPKRVSKDIIGKELGMLYLLRNHLEKLPITKTLLESICED